MGSRASDTVVLTPLTICVLDIAEILC